jgi:hypothetical protein
MCRTARVTRASLPAARCSAPHVVGRWWRAANKQTQRPVGRTLLLALRQGVRIDRPKQRAAGRVNDSDDDLGAARRIKHEPIELLAAVRHFHEIAWAYRLHAISLVLFYVNKATY